jgi:hypothetical protein
MVAFNGRSNRRFSWSLAGRTHSRLRHWTMEPEVIDGNDLPSSQEFGLENLTLAATQ